MGEGMTNELVSYGVRWSQSGEDGIIREIMRRLGVRHGWFVEFGAWDGLRFSNTRALVEAGWHGVLIEGDPVKGTELAANMRLHPRVTCMKRRVSCECGEMLHDLLTWTKVPTDFDLLSIDVDGNDYWIWQAFSPRYTPKLVVIEYNPNFSPEESKAIAYDPAHVWDHSAYFGASVAAMIDLAAKKGYMLVAYTVNLNLFFLRQDLTDGFEQVDVWEVPIGKTHGGPLITLGIIF